MKTSLRFASALFALAVSTAAVAAPASKATPYQRGALTARTSPPAAASVRATSDKFMPTPKAGQKFTSQVRCTPERMQTDAACRAHCAR